MPPIIFLTINLTLVLLTPLQPYQPSLLLLEYDVPRAASITGTLYLFVPLPGELVLQIALWAILFSIRNSIKHTNCLAQLSLPTLPLFPWHLSLSHIKLFILFFVSPHLVGRILKVHPQDFCPLIIQINTNLNMPWLV